MKIGETSVKGFLSDFGDSIHLAKIKDKYVLLLEADSVTFEEVCVAYRVSKTG